MDPSSGPQVGDRVCFRVSEVYLPEPAEVLAKLTADLEVNGVILEFSDSGSSLREFAVVQMTPEQVVLLPVGALHLVHC